MRNKFSSLHSQGGKNKTSPQPQNRPTQPPLKSFCGDLRITDTPFALANVAYNATWRAAVAFMVRVKCGFTQ